MRMLSVVAAVVLSTVLSTSIGGAIAQSAKRIPTIGVVGNNRPTTPEGARIWEAFALGLREGGWVEGETVRIEWRWGDGRKERFEELAAELVRLNVDLIVTGGSQAATAAKNATSTIPIVFVAVADPVGAGLVASLAKPGSNVTGVSNQIRDLAAKWLQLAKEMVPTLTHIAIMWNPSDPGSALSFEDAQKIYPTLGLKMTSVPVSSPRDLEPGLEILARARPDLLLVHPSTLMILHRQRIGEFARHHRLPTSSGLRVMTQDGSIVMSYGPDLADLLKRTGVYVDRLLKGARAATMPVEQPTRFELVVSRRAAQAIGLELKPAFVDRVDHLFE
jgi:putative tryptophan/tyrosine transport system substrate-binding protein